MYVLCRHEKLSDIVWTESKITTGFSIVLPVAFHFEFHEKIIFWGVSNSKF